MNLIEKRKHVSCNVHYPRPTGRLLRAFREWRLRRAKEKAAYWRGQTDVWMAVCKGQHNDYERENLAEATGNWRLYQSRVDSLLSLEQDARSLR